MSSDSLPTNVPLAPHPLDRPGQLWRWLWPLPRDPLALLDGLRARGFTGLCPQQGTDAIAWCRTWGARIRAAGFDLACGLGREGATAIGEALQLDRTVVSGVMNDEEAWHSVSDSNALADQVLHDHPDAPSWMIDCYYPLLANTGWAPVTHVWARLCGRRAPQCYWDPPPGNPGWRPSDGWVAKRLASARAQYPVLGATPAAAVRASIQLYGSSVRSTLALVQTELRTGSVWCWDDNGKTDPSTDLALQILHQRPDVVLTDVSPALAASLGITVPAGVVWSRP